MRYIQLEIETPDPPAPVEGVEDQAFRDRVTGIWNGLVTRVGTCNGLGLAFFQGPGNLRTTSDAQLAHIGSESGRRFEYLKLMKPSEDAYRQDVHGFYASASRLPEHLWELEEVANGDIGIVGYAAPLVAEARQDVAAFHELVVTASPVTISTERATDERLGLLLDRIAGYRADIAGRTASVLAPYHVGYLDNITEAVTECLAGLEEARTFTNEEGFKANVDTLVTVYVANIVLAVDALKDFLEDAAELMQNWVVDLQERRKAVSALLVQLTEIVRDDDPDDTAGRIAALQEFAKEVNEEFAGSDSDS